nr:hypothetical protein [uncultured Kingella sp.]
MGVPCWGNGFQAAFWASAILAICAHSCGHDLVKSRCRLFGAFRQPEKGLAFCRFQAAAAPRLWL